MFDMRVFLSALEFQFWLKLFYFFSLEEEDPFQNIFIIIIINIIII